MRLNTLNLMLAGLMISAALALPAGAADDSEEEFDSP